MLIPKKNRKEVYKYLFKGMMLFHTDHFLWCCPLPYCAASGRAAAMMCILSVGSGVCLACVAHLCCLRARCNLFKGQYLWH